MRGLLAWYNNNMNIETTAAALKQGDHFWSHGKLYLAHAVTPTNVGITVNVGSGVILMREWSPIHIKTW